MFLFLLFPLISSLKGKFQLRRCYEGPFMRNTIRLNPPNIVEKDGVACILSISWQIARKRKVASGDPENPTRTKEQCDPNSVSGSVAAAEKGQMPGSWQDAEDITIRPDVGREPIEEGNVVELDDDKERRITAEASKINHTTTSSTSQSFMVNLKRI